MHGTRGRGGSGPTLRAWPTSMTMSYELGALVWTQNLRLPLKDEDFLPRWRIDP